MASGGAASKASKVVKAVAAKASKAAAPPKSGSKPKPKPAPATPAEPKPKRPPTNSGLHVVLPVSPACRKFFNQVEMSRTQVTKQLWAYIKAHDLQDSEKKRVIVPDEKLRAFLGCKDRIDMTEIPGLLSPHFPKKSA